MTRLVSLLLPIVAFVVPGALAAGAPGPLAPLAADQTVAERARLVLAMREYREALEEVRRFDEAAVERAQRELDRHRELLSRGIVAVKDVSEREVALGAARDKLDQTGRQILGADHAITEILVEARLAERRARPGRTEPGITLVRYHGSMRWSLADAPKIQSFFARRFGRPLPVSAFGQTPLHDRLGFDHRDALDVAVLPDSAEGTALMAYLRNAGISFLAYRDSVPGEATGAHIHIGQASPRL